MQQLILVPGVNNCVFLSCRFISLSCWYKPRLWQSSGRMDCLGALMTVVHAWQPFSVLITLPERMPKLLAQNAMSYAVWLPVSRSQTYSLWPRSDPRFVSRTESRVRSWTISWQLAAVLYVCWFSPRKKSRKVVQLCTPRAEALLISWISRNLSAFSLYWILWCNAHLFQAFCESGLLFAEAITFEQIFCTTVLLYIYIYIYIYIFFFFTSFLYLF